MSMFNRNTITKAALIAGMFVCTPALAAESVFYVGINSGWNATEFEKNTSMDMGGNTYTSENMGSAAAPTFGGMAGIKFPISTGYVGIETNVSDSGAEYEKTETVNGQTTFDQQISSNLSYGLSGILAFNLNAHSQVYGIAGYQMTDIEAKTSTRNTSTGDVANDSYNEDTGGFRVGLGFETAITSSLSARFEWTRTAYDAEEFQIETANGPSDIELEGIENRIAIGVIGHF